MKLRNQSCQLIPGHCKFPDLALNFQAGEFYFQGLEFFSQRIGKKVPSLEKDKNMQCPRIS